jgi:hypothetical protein
MDLLTFGKGMIRIVKKERGRKGMSQIRVRKKNLGGQWNR